MPSGPLPNPDVLVSLVRTVRGERVMLDEDIAAVYGVATKALNQAVKRKESRFPGDFMFQLTAEESRHMRSQNVTASRRNVRTPPYAITEQGVAMLSSVLRSARAIEANIAIIRTFVQLRRLMDSNRHLARKIEAMERKYDEQFAAVFAAIKRLIAEDDARKSMPKRTIGFQP